MSLVGLRVIHGSNSARDGASKPDETKVDTTDEPINVLLLQPGDIRHVLKTIAQRRAHKYGSRPIHFYVADSPTEVVARHLLLLLVAQDYTMPVRLRANTWLEIFGNALVQDRTSKYIAQKGQELIQLICDRKGVLAPMVDTSLLKYREVDELQEVFQGWSHKAPYDLEKLRDYRLRHLYGERYDFRRNVLDWDYQMMVKSVAGLVHVVHYRQWRQTGVAFEFGDQTYTVPNRTMATYAQGREKGLTKLRLGFWLDIVNSPYFALGTSCRENGKLDAELFRVDARGRGTEQWRHTAVEMSVFNVLSYFHGIETGKPYTMHTKNAIYSGLGHFDERRKAKAEAEKAEAAAAANSAEQGKKQDDAPDAPGGEEESKGDAALEDANDDADGTGVGAAADDESPPPLEPVGSTAADAGGEDDSDAGASAPAPAPEVQVNSTLIPGVHVPSEEVVAERKRQLEAQAKAKTASEEARRREQAVMRARRIVESFHGVKVFPFAGKLADMVGKKRFRNLFDVVVVSNHASQDIGDNLKSILRSKAVVVAELARGMVTLKPEQQDEFRKRVNALCRELGCYFHGKDENVSDDSFSTGTAVGIAKPGMTADDILKAVKRARRPEYQTYVWEEHMAQERSAAWKRMQEAEKKTLEAKKAREEARQQRQDVEHGVEEAKGGGDGSGGGAN